MRTEHFARLTTRDGQFNETCSVAKARKMLKQGLLRSFDGRVIQPSREVEHCFTVLKRNMNKVSNFLGLQ